MTILGAIFAGGQARRFGSDKAAILIDGTALLERIAAQLGPQVDAMAVVGRDWPGLLRIDDRPEPGLGPLGALAGALLHAAKSGHELVLTTGCDLPELPHDLVERLSPPPAIIQGQPLIGLWPARLGEPLASYLANGGDRAMRAWILHAETRRVAAGRELPNINTREELDRYLAGRITPPAGPPPSR